MSVYYDCVLEPIYGEIKINIESAEGGKYKIVNFFSLATWTGHKSPKSVAVIFCTHCVFDLHADSYYDNVS